jgi:hypothetical protein
MWQPLCSTWPFDKPPCACSEYSSAKKNQLVTRKYCVRLPPCERDCFYNHSAFTTPPLSVKKREKKCYSLIGISPTRNPTKVGFCWYGCPFLLHSNVVCMYVCVDIYSCNDVSVCACGGGGVCVCVGGACVHACVRAVRDQRAIRKCRPSLSI